jgi:hypothetical protein
VQIIFLSTFSVFSVPFGAFSGMPFAHALWITAGFLPIPNPRIWYEPFSADSTRTLFTFSTWHRFLQTIGYETIIKTEQKE